MPLSQDAAVEHAVTDLATRLNINRTEIEVESLEEATFPNSGLGALEQGEMAMDVLTKGTRMRLRVGSRLFEYRAGRAQMRLVGFDERNYLLKL
jgi:hypothetical protein